MIVTDTQLYLSVGLPVLAVLMGALSNALQVNTINARLTSMETSINSRFTSIEGRFTSLEARFDTLVGKVVEVDNRLTRVEALLERH